ncbi:MAG: HAD family hydrolase [Tissierellia bacterium]|nr:HAD family hydrolase [Tissierellia bacterium]
MIKLIAFDLDETLFNDEHKIDQKNYEYIKKARDLGIHMVPASGRGPGFLGTLYEDLDINTDSDYSILANGATVVKNKSGAPLTSNPIDKKIAKKVFDYGISHDFNVHVYTTNGVYFYRIFEQEKRYTDRFKENRIIVDDDDFSHVEDETILKLIICDMDLDYLKTLKEEVENLSYGDIEVSYSSNRYMEINRKGIDKGVGLNDLCKALNIDIKDTIAVGDNFNDLSMLKASGISIAVNNAHPDIKKACDYVTDATNNENAIAEIVEKFILKTEE